MNSSLIIRNGRVWDGQRFLEADILIEGDKIVEIEQNIPDTAFWEYNAAGKLVSAGLVDLHVHMRGVSSDKFGVCADTACLPFGVTAAADGGAARGDKGVLQALCVKSLVFIPVPIRQNRADFTKTEQLLAAYGDRAVGLKVYFDTAQCDVKDAAPLAEVCRYAHERGLRVMVHSTGSPVPMADLLATLGPGDILTHAFHGGPNHAAEDNFRSMVGAKERGIVIDAGLAGHVHTDFSVFGAAIKAGVLPDVISTDITRLSAYCRGGRYGLTACMSIARTLGMSEEDVFRAVTSAPARALGKAGQWGALRVGGYADIAVLAQKEEPFALTDGTGNRLQYDRGYRCVLTLSDGIVVYSD